VRIAALVKQVPEAEEMRLGPDGRLVRDGVPLEMSAYCRRAVAEGVLLARATGGRCTVFTLGPPSAQDVLREAVAFGADEGVHLTDPAFAGSDTLATARALAAALVREGPFDLVLVGRNSVDADTGQVGPQLAELLDLPFATGVKRLELRSGADGHPVAADVGLELDDEWVEATVPLPAVLATAERLIDPCKIKDPAAWAAVDPVRIRRLDAAALGPGPWGSEGSPTWVGETRTEVVERERRVLTGTVPEQVDAAVAALADRGVLAAVEGRASGPEERLPDTGGAGPVVGVVAEPGRDRVTAELLSAAARLAAELGGRTAVLGPDPGEPAVLARLGADEVHAVEGVGAPEDLVGVLARWARLVQPWAVLAPSTSWGREVAARLAVVLGAGLTGDAVGLAVEDGRLVAWKPAFGGALVAAVRSSTPVQLATVRPGVLTRLAPRDGSGVALHMHRATPRGRITVHRRRREDDLDLLANAAVVIGVGQGVAPARYGELEGLRRLLGAELAATRKVTDRGWMPHARQIGITGHAISPRLYVALGIRGTYNHTVGVRSAGTVLAVNTDPSAPVFDAADLGIVGDWGEVVVELERRLTSILRPAGSGGVGSGGVLVDRRSPT
jgi:electron transfer flavoprotein alpha subunit